MKLTHLRLTLVVVATTLLSSVVASTTSYVMLRNATTSTTDAAVESVAPVDTIATDDEDSLVDPDGGLVTDDGPVGAIAARLDFRDRPTNGTYLFTGYLADTTALYYHPHYGWHEDNGNEFDVSIRDAWYVAQQLAAPSWPDAAPQDDRGVWPDWVGAVSSGTANGTSAGVIVTLAMLDAHYGYDLAGALRVGGTGGIDTDGDVRPIAQVDVKYLSMAHAGADVFFTPTYPAVARQRGAVEVRCPVVFRQGYHQTHEQAKVDALYACRDEAARVHQSGRQPSLPVVAVTWDIDTAIAYLCGAGSADACTLFDQRVTALL